MRAAVLRQGEMLVRDDVPDPVPSFGQVLVQVKACGICGSDLHFAKHGGTMMALTDEMGGIPDIGVGRVDLDKDVFMGHEFAAEIVEVGQDTIAPPIGTLVTSIPVMLSMTGIQPLAYTNDLPCGYGEQMLLSAAFLTPVPNGLPAAQAAMTEPMAVGLHAVNKARLAPGDGAAVVGCGPVGLAVIASLSTRGVEPIVAADYSPGRRQLALTMGAHRAVDPAGESVSEAWSAVGSSRPLVVFEAVGAPGVIDEIARWVPPSSRIVVVGVCMGRDQVTPIWAITKELNIQFVLAYDPAEFSESLRSIAEGQIDVSPLITSEVSLDGVPEAFAALADPERECKIVVVP